MNLNPNSNLNCLPEISLTIAIKLEY